MSDPTECAHKGCHCKLDANAISASGRSYCSQRCVDGRGCDHADCNCGEFPEAEPRESEVTGTSKP